MEQEGQEEESRGWNIVSFTWLTNPPEWLAAAAYVVATVLIAYVLYMVGLGLVAFTKDAPNNKRYVSGYRGLIV